MQGFFLFEKPYMYDSAGGQNSEQNNFSDNVGYDIVDHRDSADLIVKTDDNWLKDPARVYPVIIDPPVSIGVAGDTYAEEGFPNTATWPQRALYVGKTNYGSKLRTRAFIVYQIPNIGGGRVLSASANVYQYGCDGAALNYPVGVWSTPSFELSKLTWNNMP